MAGDELFCHIPRMTDVELAIQPFCIRGGVSLDHLQHGHIDFDPAKNVQHDADAAHTAQPTARATLSGTAQR